MPSTVAEPVRTELERSELQAVLRSQLFVRSPTLAHLLSYLCEKKFAGESEQIKEYSIALDVFGRHDSFDQDTDSIVRVQANRLRKRLAEYYGGEGARDSLRIAIPIGQYVPTFEKAEPLLRDLCGETFFEQRQMESLLENRPLLLPNLHVCNQADTQSVDVLHHLIGDYLPAEVAHDLVHVHADASIRLRLEIHRFDLGLNNSELSCPITTDGSASILAAPFHAVGPIYIRV